MAHQRITPVEVAIALYQGSKVRVILTCRVTLSSETMLAGWCAQGRSDLSHWRRPLKVQGAPSDDSTEKFRRILDVDVIMVFRKHTKQELKWFNRIIKGEPLFIFCLIFCRTTHSPQPPQRAWWANATLSNLFGIKVPFQHWRFVGESTGFEQDSCGYEAKQPYKGISTYSFLK